MDMKTTVRAWVLALGGLVFLTPAAQSALAQCGTPDKAVKPSVWHPQAGGAHLRMIGDGDWDGAGSIVGMWHVVFTAHTAGGAPLPTPMVVDNALVTWHPDHTEIMNSVRPPQDGNFCMGVWEQTGRDQYYLNHFAWYANEFPNSTNNGIGQAEGPTHIQEWVTVSPDGNHFTGSFALTAYTGSNGILASFTGSLSGTRITVNTTEEDLVN
jgi:hypothetical protein